MAGESMSEIKIGDIVARKSYGYDVFFKVVDISEKDGERILTSRHQLQDRGRCAGIRPELQPEARSGNTGTGVGGSGKNCGRQDERHDVLPLL